MPVAPENGVVREAVGVLKPDEEHPQRREDLLAEGARDRVLVLAARPEQPEEAFVGLQREEPPLVEQHVERAEQRPSVHVEHLVQAEGDPPGRLALGRIDDSKHLAVREQTDMHARLPEKSLEALMRAR